MIETFHPCRNGSLSCENRSKPVGVGHGDGGRYILASFVVSLS